jgi:hypothetical protein
LRQKQRPENQSNEMDIFAEKAEMINNMIRRGEISVEEAESLLMDERRML